MFAIPIICFSIDKTSGNLTLIKGLDAEAVQSYTLRIGTEEAMESGRLGLAVDQQLAHSAVVHIRVVDVNDWIPTFESERYEFKVIDSAEPGTVVGQVAGFDEDAEVMFEG